MKPTYLSILLFLSFLLINCTKDETKPTDPIGEEKPEPEEPKEPEEPVFEVYFTFNVKDFIETDETDNWIMIHNGSGELIDIKPFESSQSINFEANIDSIPDNMSISILKSTSYSNSTAKGVRYLIETYPNITKESIWNYKPIGKPRREVQMGEDFDITVENMNGVTPLRDFAPTFSSHAISTPTSLIFTTSNSGVTSNNVLIELTTGPIRNFSGEPYLMSILGANYQLKYSFFEPSINGDKVVLDYGDFKEFDSQIMLELPENTGNSFVLSGFDETESFKETDIGFTLFSFSRTDRQLVPIGLLDKFSTYKTFYSITTDLYSYVYNKNGEHPEIDDLKIPEVPSISIANEAIANFTLSVDQPYERKSGFWGYQETVQDSTNYLSWTIHSTNDSFPIIQELPQDLIEHLPGLSLDQIDLWFINLFMISDNYPTFIQKLFGPDEQGFDDGFEEKKFTFFY